MPEQQPIVGGRCDWSRYIGVRVLEVAGAKTRIEGYDPGEGSFKRWVYTSELSDCKPPPRLRPRIERLSPFGALLIAVDLALPDPIPGTPGPITAAVLASEMLPIVAPPPDAPTTMAIVDRPDRGGFEVQVCLRDRCTPTRKFASMDVRRGNDATLSAGGGKEVDCSKGIAQMRKKYKKHLTQGADLYVVRASNVHPQYLGRGVGVAMYIAAVQEARRRGGLLIADACEQRGSTSEAAERVWSSERFRAVADVAGFVGFAREAPQGAQVEKLSVKGPYVLKADDPTHNARVFKAFRARPQALRGGQGNRLDPAAVLITELVAGQRVEMEHTTDPLTAIEIALDHLAEDKWYYTKLATIHEDLPLHADDTVLHSLGQRLDDLGFQNKQEAIGEFIATGGAGWRDAGEFLSAMARDVWDFDFRHVGNTESRPIYEQAAEAIESARAALAAQAAEGLVREERLPTGAPMRVKLPQLAAYRFALDALFEEREDEPALDWFVEACSPQGAPYDRGLIEHVVKQMSEERQVLESDVEKEMKKPLRSAIGPDYERDQGAIRSHKAIIRDLGKWLSKLGKAQGLVREERLPMGTMCVQPDGVEHVVGDLEAAEPLIRPGGSAWDPTVAQRVKPLLAEKGYVLGRPIGEGTFAEVFEVVGRPDLVVKITADANEAAAVTKIVAGGYDGLPALARFFCGYVIPDVSVVLDDVSPLMRKRYGADPKVPLYVLVVERLKPLHGRGAGNVQGALHTHGLGYVAWVYRKTLGSTGHHVDRQQRLMMRSADEGGYGALSPEDAWHDAKKHYAWLSNVLPPEQDARLEQTIAEMARRGVLWSDLHGGNVMQDVQGNLKIVDLGVASDVLRKQIEADVPALRRS